MTGPGVDEGTDKAMGAGMHPLPPGCLAALVTHLARPVPPGPVLPAFPDGFLPHQETAPEPGPYRALFRRVGEDWLWVSRLVMDDDRLAAILADPATEIWTLRRAGPAGEGEAAEDLALLELDFRQPGACEIVFFGLVPELAGRRLGPALMALAFARARARGASRIWLHTCSNDHPAALPFYRAQGFVAFARGVEVMADPRLAGLIRADAAPHVALIPPG